MAVKLTKREYEILQRISKPVDEIAWELGMSPLTVETHVKNLRNKLQCRNKIEVVIKSMRLELMDIFNFII